LRANYTNTASVEASKLFVVAYRNIFFGDVAVAMIRPVDQNGRKLAPTTLQAVLNCIEVGINNTQIYYQTGVISKCTRKKQHNLAAWGQPYAPNCVKIVRPSTF
jgi:hypothetical protein